MQKLQASSARAAEAGGEGRPSNPHGYEAVKKPTIPIIPIPQSRERNLQLFVFQKITADASLL
jgi:hypothetical protein